MIKAYLKYRRAMFAFFVLSAAVFLVVSLVYGTSLAPVLYSMLILTFLFFLWAVRDAARFSAKTRQLRLIRENLTAYSHDFPQAENRTEEQYEDIIRALYRVIAESTAAMENGHTEQVAYYTLWLHQIKTPISAMRLALQSGMENNAVFEQELFKIEQYVEMALQFVKMKDMANDLVIREYALRDIVNASVRKYSTLFIYKKLSVDIAPIHTVVTTDSKWVSYLIEQMLSNAIKYTPAGVIRIYPLGEDGLAIEDSGIGIRPEDMERIFEKGYTGYNGRLDKRASGIGLYMAQRIAERLSIRLNITSEVGRGTRAVLTFPKREEETAE